MHVICLEEDAFYKLFEKVVDHLKTTQGDQQPKWIDGDEAMKMLNISSKTTLLKMRQEGKIRYSQPEKKIILYDRDSINGYLDHHAKDTF